MIDSNSNKKQTRIPGILLLFLLSLITGGVSGLIASNFIVSNLQLNLGFNPGGNRPVIESVPQIDEQAIVPLYYKKDKSNNAINQVFLASEQVGTALALTSDGWLVTTSQDELTAGQVVAFVNGVSYDLEQIILDPVVNVQFLKIDADDLLATSFAGRNDLAIGMKVYVVGQNNRLAPAFVDNLHLVKQDSRDDLIQSSEQLNRRIHLSDSLAQFPIGSPVFLSNGSVVGMLADKSAEFVLPAYSFSAYIRPMLREQKVVRPVLGVHYIDLSLNDGIAISDELDGNLISGALLAGDVRRPAITFNGPASAAGLKPGDVILEIEGEQINLQKGLAEIVNEYDPEESISVKVLRDLEKLDLTVKLGTLEQ